jgi:hypothetical protein
LVSCRPREGEQRTQATEKHDDEDDDGCDEHGKVFSEVQVGTADDGMCVKTVLLKYPCRKV